MDVTCIVVANISQENCRVIEEVIHFRLGEPCLGGQMFPIPVAGSIEFDDEVKYWC